jgi:NAD(P)-dependent dehydrogenase (short-subunit alcohol dehydrogenase family)
VTGGNGGIGLGIAQSLALAGADVAIWGTNEEKNARAVATLSAIGTRVAAFMCDVGDELEVDRTFTQTLETLGHVDSCFANAGIGGSGKAFNEMPFDEWRQVMRVNLDGAFLTLRAAARHMVERGEGGSLVVTSSLTAIEAAPRSEHYAASKAGLIALVKSLAVELARHRIRANAIMPGWVETDMTAPMLNSKTFQERVLPRVPLRRWASPSDLGGVAVYLASSASSYHTGDVLRVDGGYSVF